MLEGCATPAGTMRFAVRHGMRTLPGFYSVAQDLTLSSLGIGTYLGGMDAATDAAYTDSVMEAVRGGVNVIDTSLNYRHQRSERSVGVAMVKLASTHDARRDELLVCTKAGYLVPDAVPSALDPAEVFGGMHSMAPVFLEDQLNRSRVNLAVETIDVFYLHNPETQAADARFYDRVRRAFEAMERFAEAGRIRYYGAATWNGFRAAADGLSLVRMAEIAREVAGEQHRFRFIQLPFNLAMTEALTVRRESMGDQPLTTLAAAKRLGITVVASASLLQSRLLTAGLPLELIVRLGETATPAKRALQFTRSTPGIATALAGMSNSEHVRENLGIRSMPPLTAEQVLAVFEKDAL